MSQNYMNDISITLLYNAPNNIKYNGLKGSQETIKAIINLNLDYLKLKNINAIH